MIATPVFDAAYSSPYSSGYSSLHSTASSSSSGGVDGVMIFVIGIFAVLYLLAWALAMITVTQAARDKGYLDISGRLWFIGLFGFIFTPAVIVAALPDKKLRDTLENPPSAPSGTGPAPSATAPVTNDDLPAI